MQIYVHASCIHAYIHTHTNVCVYIYIYIYICIQVPDTPRLDIGRQYIVSYPGQAIDIELSAAVVDVAERLILRIEVVETRIDHGIMLALSIRCSFLCVCECVSAWERFWRRGMKTVGTRAEFCLMESHVCLCVYI